jgi:hypothetical protein
VIVPALLLISACVMGVGNALIRTGLTAGILIISTAAFIAHANRPHQQFIWCAWEELAEQIPDGSPQTIYAFEDLIAYHLWFATRNRPDVTVTKVENSMIAEDRSYFLPRRFEGVKKAAPDTVARGEHFWVAFRDIRWDERHPPLSMLLNSNNKVKREHHVDVNGQLKAFIVEFEK